MVFLVDYGKKGKNPHAFKRIWLFVCWFFKPLSRNKTRLFMIFCSNTNHESIPNHILPSKNISGQKKLWKCVKPTAHVLIIFSVQKVLHVLHSWDCNNAKKIVKRSIVAWKFKKKLRFVHLCGALWVFMSCGILCMHWQNARLLQKGIFFSKTNQDGFSHSLKRSQYNRTLL